MAKAKTRIWSLALLLLATGGHVGAVFLPPTNLFARAGECVTCPGTKPSDGLCCQGNRTCNVLAANTTVLCCDIPDEEGGCKGVHLIPCDIQMQNPIINPNADLKTIALNGVLGKCGDLCCPFGYTCSTENGKQFCKQDANQNAAPIQTTPSLSSTVRPTTSTHTTSTSTVSPGSTSTEPSQATTSPVIEEGSSSPSTASIIGGVVGGVLGLVVLSIVACVCLGRRRRRKREHMDTLKMHRSTSSFGNIIANPIISKPIVDDSSTMRTDFNRKSPVTTPDSSPGVTRRDPNFGGPARRMMPTGGHDDGVSSLSDSSMPATPPRALQHGQVPPIRGMRNSSIAYGVPGPAGAPTTPLRQREPSLETLKVFADPQTVGRDGGGFADRRLSNFTTFSNLMEQADLAGVHRGEPYVPPGSAQGTPASRRR